MDEEALKLLGKRAKLDSTRFNKLPLLINEDWGSEVLKQAYKNRLTGEDRVELFRSMKEHQKIVVTGPLKSGVAVAASMVADEFNRKAIPLKGSFKGIIKSIEEYDGAAIFYSTDIVDRCDSFSDSIAVAMVMRPVNDVVSSQNSCQWTGDADLISKYPSDYRQSPSAGMVYRFWYDVQKKIIKYPYDIIYGSLSRHRLWLDEKDRPYG